MNLIWGRRMPLTRDFPAHGHILAWINSDDTYNPEPFVRQFNSWRNIRTSDWYTVMPISSTRRTTIIGTFPAAQTDRTRLLQGYVHIPQQSAFFRPTYGKKWVHSIHPSFFAMDYDLWVRLSALTPLVYLPNKIWANFRLHGDGKTIASDDRCWPEMLRVHRREGGSWLSIIQTKILYPAVNRSHYKPAA